MIAQVDCCEASKRMDSESLLQRPMTDSIIERSQGRSESAAVDECGHGGVAEEMRTESPRVGPLKSLRHRRASAPGVHSASSTSTSTTSHSMSAAPTPNVAALT